MARLLLVLASISFFAGPEVVSVWRGSARADLALAVGTTTRGVAKDGIAYGYAVVKNNGKKARADAIEWCRKFKDAPEPAKKCRLVASLSEGCVVMAMDPKPGTPGAGWSVSESVDTAIEDAVAQCREVSPKNRRSACVVDTLACDFKDHKRTIEGYTRGIELLPGKALVHRTRGYHNFFVGNFEEAANDLSQALKIQTNPYPVLFLYLAQARGGDIAATATLEKNAKAIESKAWPYASIELMLGQRDVEAARAAASNDGEKCEAHFYIGEHYLIEGNTAAAETELRAAAETCPRSFEEYFAAVGELERLKR